MEMVNEMPEHIPGLIWHCSISGEIEFLVEAVVRECGEREKVSEPAQVLVEK
jgi:hypothetical protein